MKYFFFYLLVINIYGFFIMHSDKKKAMKGNWRTSEKMLFIIALAFGSLGILCGMYAFRHKTKHLKFVIGIPLILFIQVYAFIKFFSL